MGTFCWVIVWLSCGFSASAELFVLVFVNWLQTLNEDKASQVWIECSSKKCAIGFFVEKNYDAQKMIKRNSSFETNSLKGKF